MKTVKAMLKKSVKAMLLCVVFALFVSGCGISGGETDPAGKDTQAGVETPKRPAALPKKFRLEEEKEGEGKEGESSDPNPYYVREYADYKPGDLPGQISSLFTYRLHPKGQFIMKETLVRVSEEEEIRKFESYVEYYPEDQFSPEVRKICFEQEEIKDGSVESFDVLEEGYVFAVTCKNPEQEGPKERHYAVYTDWEGAPVKVLEATPETVPEIDRQPESYQLYSDGKGYLCEVYTQQIFVMNEEGQQIGSLDLSEGRRNMISQVLRDDGGNLLFVASLGQGRYRFLSLNEKGGWQERGVLDFQRIVDFVGISGGEIYFCDSSDLVAWDTESGSKRKVVSLAQLGYSFGDELLLLGYPEGDFRVRCVKSEEDYGMLLSRERDFETDTISLMGLATGYADWGDVVRGCGDFNRKTPDLSVAVDQFSEQDTDRSRFLMDLVLGEEVDYDILFVSKEDMKMLAEAGALADLRTILSQETLQAFYPAVLELGTHEGMLAGLTQQITVNSLVTSRSLWDGDTWTVQDIQKILEEHPQIREILDWSFQGWSVGAGSVLYYLCGGNDLENSGLYDRETGESYFEKNGFAGALEMAKKHIESQDEKFGYEKLKDGECLGVVDSFFSFVPFSEAMGQYGGEDSDNNVVGFPVSGNGGKHYVSASDYLVVNRKSQKQESIRRFLEYMMGADNLARIEYGMGNVRRDMIDYCVKPVSWKEGSYWWHIKGSTHKYEIGTKEEAALYKKKWDAILEEGHPARRSEEIWEIVEEESGQFFEGTLDAQTAVKRIDKRVTLYLKEQK